MAGSEAEDPWDFRVLGYSAETVSEETHGTLAEMKTQAGFEAKTKGEAAFLAQDWLAEVEKQHDPGLDSC